VISAAPQEIIQFGDSKVIVPPITSSARASSRRTHREWISIISRAAAWEIQVLEELRANSGISHDQIIYNG